MVAPAERRARHARGVSNTYTKLVLVGGLTLVASSFPDILVKELAGSLPSWWLATKAALLIAGTITLYAGAREKKLAKYGVVLTAIIAVQVVVSQIDASPWWLSHFPRSGFGGQFGGPILLKLLGTVPVVGVLLLLFRSRHEVYLVKGDLSVKASRIAWLGITEGRIEWRRLSVISGLLLAAGTLLLTLLTVTGFSLPSTVGRLPSLLPLIVLLALANSFSEGVVYRSAVLGPLRKALPKEVVVVIAAAFFGIAHYYGAPRGILGVVMSGVLGWFLCRSMVETQGFLAAWIIHFFQDLVIFSTVAVLGGL